MKVSDVMQTQVDYVTTQTSVKDVCRLIFGRGINGVPVCKDKKVIGFITERDILSRFYPSIQEYIEDPVHTADFEAMEEKVSEIFSLTASDIMSKDPTTVKPDTPLLRAQSLMAVHKVGRLPVVDEKGNLAGILSKGDIFRVMVGDKLPFTATEEYHDWLSKHYDLTVDWEERLGNEVPDLSTLFKKEGLESVLDIGCGTGEHDIALAKKGFRVLGIESSSLMLRAAQGKLSKVDSQTAQRLDFKTGDYVNILRNQQDKFDAAIFMGNAFSHMDTNYKGVLAATVDVLASKNAILVFQLINYEKVFKTKGRFLDLVFNKSKLGIAHEHAFLEFYNSGSKKGDFHTLTMVILDFDGKKWKYRSLNSTPIAPVDKTMITNLLKKHGFRKVSFYGSKFFGPLFKEPFQPLESDWLNVVAKR